MTRLVGPQESQVTSQQSRILATQMRRAPAWWTAQDHAKALGLSVVLTESLLARWDIPHSRRAITRERQWATRALEREIELAKNDPPAKPYKYKKGPLQW